jgi:ribosomal protein S18 acetylase RimI-like enzyme
MSADRHPAATSSVEVRAAGDIGADRGGATLRPVRPGDEDFLFAVYASTRTEELAVLPWSAADKTAFLRLQFAAQHRDYHERSPAAAFDVIERDGEPVGRLYVERRTDEIRVIDIALLPAHRNAGIGGALIAAVLHEAAATARPVRIHVERDNRARVLYDRFGFVAIGTSGPYVLMEWRPPVPQHTDARSGVHERNR